jgi:DNA primase
MSIIDVLRSKNLSEYIPNLEYQSDGTYRKVCEFHTNATNPTSFTVFPNNTWYCFSCGEAGDIISYVMLRDGVPFDVAIQTLCEDYSINLSKDEIYNKQKSIVERNEEYCKKYEKKLDRIYDYLTKKRGLNDNIIKLYRCGYSESSAGNCLTIAMHDQYQRLIGFGYRFFDKLPKYKNSKNNELFTKGEYLFNINNAQKLIKKKKRLYVVEGHIDAMSAQQQGEPCVAYCGITFSKDHVMLIKKLTEYIDGVQIILVPDNDDKANQWVNRGRLLFMNNYKEANVKVAVIGGDV